MIKKTISIFLSLSAICSAFSQIKPEVVEVEKIHEPQVKEAVKILRLPAAEPPEKKLPVRYTPIEVPVQTRFQVRPIQADKLTALPEEKSFNNYLKAGYGNNNTLLGAGFISHKLKSGHDLGLYFKYWSTDGNIRSSRINDQQWQTKAALFYTMNMEKGTAKITGGYEGQGVNFYGLSESLTEEQKEAAVKTNPKQTFNNIYAKIDWSADKKLYLDQAALSMRRSWDRHKSRETYISLESRWLKHPLITRKIKDTWTLEADMDFDLSYQNTTFKENEAPYAQRFEYLTTSIAPILKLSNGASHFKLGLDLTYNAAFQRKLSGLYIYPLAELFIKTRESVGLFAGIRGDLQNHTYYGLIQENPYSAPYQELKPTDTPFEVYGGLRGKPDTKFAYKIEASYAQKKDDLFFINSPLKPSKNYGYENTFQARYADNNTFGLSAKVNYIPVSKFELSAEWSFKNYDVKPAQEAWNRPNFEGNLSATYKMLNDRLSIGADIFYVGRRYDITYAYNSSGKINSTGNITLKAYVNTNLKSVYKITPRWSAFLQLNNLFDNAYYRYKNYRMKGFQILGGLTYKFH